MRTLILIILLTVTAGFSVPSGKVLVCVSTGATKYHSPLLDMFRRACRGIDKGAPKLRGLIGGVQVTNLLLPVVRDALRNITNSYFPAIRTLPSHPPKIPTLHLCGRLY